ncbi:MAG: nucleotide sugar dehydrogenase [Microthrixaceae bacterium]
MNICVVALGKIGLPLAVQFASMGHRVRGADINPALVDCINRGDEPFPGEGGLAELLRGVIDDGSLTATTDTTSAVSESEAVVVVVPLVVDGDARPEFTAMDAAAEAIGRGLRPGTLVSFETTLPVHTTRQRFTPRLAELSGLTPGEDLFVCFSPERVYSGRIFADLRKYPKIIGGINGESARRAEDFYQSVLSFDDRDDLSRPNGVWDVGSAEAAELVKLAETTYRDVNIGLANEFAIYARRNDMDVFSVIEAANSQPFSHIHQPGISVGGHCIPVYPRLYLSNDPDARLPKASRETNDSMPGEFAEMLRLARGGSLDGTRVLVLGLAYRGGVKEPAFSGTYSLVEELRARGAVVGVHDPLFSADELSAEGFEPAEPGEQWEALVLHTDHDEYRDLEPSDLPGVETVVDGRAFLDATLWIEAGRDYLSLRP